MIKKNKGASTMLSMSLISLLLTVFTSCNQQAILSQKVYTQKEETKNIELDIQVTTFSSSTTDVKKELDAFNTQRINQLKEYTDTLESEAIECLEDLEKSEYGRPGWKYNCYVRDTVMNATAGDMISILQTECIFTGGAHPNTFHKAYNYSLKEHKLLDKKELFNAIDPTQLNAILYKTFKEQDKSAIELFNKPTLKSANAICVAKDQIIFVYNPYTLACYADGTIKIKVDKKQIAKYIAY